MGLPVVATSIYGLRDAVDDGRTGLLVPPGQPAALADAIQRLAGDKALRLTMGRAGRERAKELFERDLVVANFMDFHRRGISP